MTEQLKAEFEAWWGVSFGPVDSYYKSDAQAAYLEATRRAEARMAERVDAAETQARVCREDAEINAARAERLTAENAALKAMIMSVETNIEIQEGISLTYNMGHCPERMLLAQIRAEANAAAIAAAKARPLAVVDPERAARDKERFEAREL